MNESSVIVNFSFKFIQNYEKNKGLEDTFENTRKYKCKHCNYDFTGIQA